jgi:hypothetical protein
MNVKGTLIVHQNLPVGIHDQAPYGFYFPKADTVVFRFLFEFIPFDHLKMPHTQSQKGQGNRHDDQHDFEPPVQGPGFMTI